ENGIDEDDVVADRARERARRRLVAARPTPRRQAFGAQAEGARDERFHGARRRVGSKEADAARHAGGGERSEQDRRDARVWPGLSAAAVGMDMRVDEARHEAGPAEIDVFARDAARRTEPLADRQDATGRNQQVPPSPSLGGEKVGVAQEREQ